DLSVRRVDGGEAVGWADHVQQSVSDDATAQMRLVDVDGRPSLIARRAVKAMDTRRRLGHDVHSVRVDHREVDPQAVRLLELPKEVPGRVERINAVGATRDVAMRDV